MLFGCALSAACQSSAPGHGERFPAPLRVLSVEPAQLLVGVDDPGAPGLAEACDEWHLTPAQVEAFFALSERYAEGQGLLQRFYFLPCRISGQLEAEGRRWGFSINAAATGSWQSGTQIRLFGCSARACEPLVLLMPDEGGDPDL